MRLDDHRIWEHRQKMLQSVHMIGRFENPLLGRRRQLQILQKALLPSVGVTKIRLSKKRLISRNAANHREFLGQEGVAMNCYTFMRRPCAHRVDRIRSRSQSAEPP